MERVTLSVDRSDAEQQCVPQAPPRPSTRKTAAFAVVGVLAVAATAALRQRDPMLAAVGRRRASGPPARRLAGYTDRDFV